MKAISDRSGALDAGLAAIREQFRVPLDFPPDVEAEAQTTVGRSLADHVDRTGMPFVTLDPASSTDLDQAFVIARSGNDLILSYAIADIGSFVAPGGAIDRESWARGETLYLPDARAPLYPRVLSEGAASLLPDGPRPSIMFTIRVAPDGQVHLDGAERAMIRSRAKLGYATVREADLPDAFFELSARIEAAETARGAARVDPPQQQVVERNGSSYQLGFRPMSAIEQANASLSLAANLAIADLLFQHGTGIFRVMAEPGQRAVSRLRHTAKALGVEWPSNHSLGERERTLNPNDRRDAAFMLAIRRAGEGARYAPYVPGQRPFHSAMAATYVHGTAPLRRLADRYITEAAVAIVNGKPVPGWVTKAFTALPDVMNRADARANQIDGAVIELAEAVALEDRVGQSLEGRVVEIDDRGARVQLCGEPVLTRIPAQGLELGQPVQLKLTEDDPSRRLMRFSIEGAALN